jgi:hypothetical protein
MIPMRTESEGSKMSILISYRFRPSLSRVLYLHGEYGRHLGKVSRFLYRYVLMLCMDCKLVIAERYLDGWEMMIKVVKGRQHQQQTISS